MTITIMKRTRESIDISNDSSSNEMRDMSNLSNVDCVRRLIREHDNELSTYDGKLLKIGNEIASGGFGSVMYLDNYPNKVIVKISPIRSDIDDNGVMKELSFYDKMKSSDYIPKFFGGGCIMSKTSKIPFYGYIVLERFSHDFSTFRRVVNSVTERDLNLVCRSVVRALRFCHDIGISHGDVNSQNVLINHDDGVIDRVVLTDFGLAETFKDTNGTHVEYKKDPSNIIGSRTYMSVDAHRGVICSRRSDMESFGYSLISWCGGLLPWKRSVGINLRDTYSEKIYHTCKSIWVDKCFRDKVVSELNISKAINYFNIIDFTHSPDSYESVPDYDAIIDIFKDV